MVTKWSHSGGQGGGGEAEEQEVLTCVSHSQHTTLHSSSSSSTEINRALITCEFEFSRIGNIKSKDNHTHTPEGMQLLTQVKTVWALAMMDKRFCGPRVWGWLTWVNILFSVYQFVWFFPKKNISECSSRCFGLVRPQAVSSMLLYSMSLVKYLINFNSKNYPNCM